MQFNNPIHLLLTSYSNSTYKGIFDKETTEYRTGIKLCILKSLSAIEIHTKMLNLLKKSSFFQLDISML